jgi:hypothetical protein
LQEALSGFAPAAAAFEKTLPGITSSFVDYMQRFRGMFMAGPLESIRKMLVRLVDIFRRNEARITAILTTMGNAFARWLDPALERFTDGTEWFIDNWDKIAGRIQRALERWALISSNIRAGVKHYGPSLGAGAKAAGAGILLGRFAPGAVSTVSAGVSAGLAGEVGGGGLAGTIAGVTHVTSVVASMGGTFTILLPVLALVVGLVGAMVDAWAHLTPIFGAFWTLLQDVFGMLWGIVSNVGSAFFSLAKILGAVILSVLTVGLTLMTFVAKYLWKGVLKPILSLVSVIFEAIAKVFDWIYQKVLWVFTSLADLFGTLHKDLLPASGGGYTPGFFDKLMSGFQSSLAAFEAQAAGDKSALSAAEQGAPGSRKTTVNDFRGSKIEVKQDFRQADPDRVWLQFVEGINDAAEQRLASALVPDFTR